MPAASALGTRINRSICCPEVTKKQRYLVVSELEDFCRHALFMGTLAIEAKVAKPFVNAYRMPTITVAAEDQLMPGYLVRTRVAGDLHAKFIPSCVCDSVAILF